jgi:hypothetical protein
LTQRASLVDAVIDVAFAIVLTGCAFLLVFAHRGLAPMVALLALIVAMRPRLWRDGFAQLAPRRIIAEPFSKAVVAMGLFTALIAASALWSPTPGAVNLALMHFLAMLVCGALAHECLTAAPSRALRLATIYALALAAAAAALMFEGLSGGYLRSVTPPEDLSPLRTKDMSALARGVGAAIVMALPAAAVIRAVTGSWPAALAPAAALMIAGMNFTITANTLGLAFGALCFVAAIKAPRATLRGIAALFIATVLVAPLAAALPAERLVENADLPASWSQRLLVAQTVAERSISQCLPLGCGADYARAWSLEGRMIEVKGSTIPLQEIPTHPHNVFLQVWLELGPAGAALLALSLLFGARALDRLELRRLSAASIAAVAATIYCSFMLEASIWQAWRLAALALAIIGASLSYSLNRRGLQNLQGRGG